MKQYFLLALLIGVLPLATAEAVYVTDNLRIGVRPEPDNNAPPVGVIVSGMKLEVLKRSDDYVKIRNSDGLEGWIKEIHITRDVPVRAQLDKVTLQFQQVNKDLEEKTLQLKNTTEANGQLTDTVATLRQANERLSAQLESVGVVKGQSLLWLWIFLGLLVTAGGGFYAGMIWHRNYVMQRLGGLRF
jgi:Bacterial SH3 domain